MSRLLAAALATCALLLTACGVPVDAEPRALDAGDVPVGVLPSASPAPESGGDARVVLYFLQGDQVVPVPRPVTGPTVGTRLIELLLAGPTEAEKSAGATSLIPASVSVVDVEVQGTIAVVTLAGTPDQARPQAPAFAQIVATLTPERATGVRFRLDGADLPVPRADGSLTDAPVTRADYAELLGDPPPTPEASAGPAMSDPAPLPSG